MGKTKNAKTGGQKGSSSTKLKPNKNVFKAKFTAKAKDRKSHSKAVKTNLKKMGFDSAKTIEQLNADHNKVLLTPTVKPKPQPSPPSTHRATRKPIVEEEMPDVDDVIQSLDTL